ncbi:hypothetical protein HYR99_37240 [Candidatus Poribacteria bacterium]|nr:hypothetical protein [Candidatus Poribacteria bacterium]
MVFFPTCPKCFQKEQVQQAVLWQKFVEGLSGGVQGLDPKTFIPTSGLNQADWEVVNYSGLAAPDAQEPGTIIPQNLEKWANLMPEWAASYVPGNNFYDQYFAFLNAIKLTGGDPAQQQIVDRLKPQVEKARKQLSGDRTQAFKDWADFDDAQSKAPPSVKQTFEQWYNANWAATITADEREFSGLNTQMLSAIQKVGGPDAPTISSAIAAAALTPTAGNALKESGTVALPDYKIENKGSLNEWFLASLDSDGKKPQIDFSIDLSQTEADASLRSSYFNSSASGGFSRFFWGGSASASYSQSSNSQDYFGQIQKFTFRYTAQTAQVFTVTTGSWYRTDIVSGFYDKIDPKSVFANKPAFGENGFLNLRTRQIYVVFRPTIYLEGSTDAISKVVDTFNQQSSASFSIGAWFWSGRASVSQGRSSYDANVQTLNNGRQIKVEYNTRAPRVIGIIPTNLQP